MEKLIPVLLGGDLNAYSMACAFYEYNGSHSHVFARQKLALTSISKHITLHIKEGLDSPDIAVPALLRFAEEHKGQSLILVPCADWYMEMLEYARDALEGHFYFLIPNLDVWRAVSDKATFIKLLDKYNISHPKTCVFDKSFSNFEIDTGKLSPPFVLKPSSSTDYWKNPFEGMRKVYFTHSLSESAVYARRIFSSGYDGKLLLQERIGKLDTPHSSVLTTYSNREGTVIRAVLADVLLEEKGPRARGNYSALMTRALDKTSYRIIEMLEGINYTGVANFDILYDGGEGLVLELNPRQGRSFDYMRGAGVNIPELLHADYLGLNICPSFLYEPTLWRSVKKRTLVKYCRDRGLLKKALMLERCGKEITPYEYKRDKSKERLLYVMTHLYKESRRYKKYESAENV